MNVAVVRIANNRGNGIVLDIYDSYAKCELGFKETWGNRSRSSYIDLAAHRPPQQHSFLRFRFYQTQHICNENLLWLISEMASPTLTITRKMKQMQHEGAVIMYNYTNTTKQLSWDSIHQKGLRQTKVAPINSSLYLPTQCP